MKTNTKIKDNKELSLIPVEIQKKVSSVGKAASEYSITTADDLKVGADLLHSIKEVKKALTTRKEEITRPLMQSLASTRDLFKPYEQQYVEAESVVKEKMVTFQTEEEERIEAKKASITARVEKGTMKAETAMEKL